MRCFNHHDRDAFGIDIITGKTLCLECLEEYKGRIIEKNNAESKIRVDLIDISYEQIKTNEKVMQFNEKTIAFTDNHIKTSLKISKVSGIITAILAILSFIFITPCFAGVVFSILSLLCYFSYKTCKEYMKQ